VRITFYDAQGGAIPGCGAACEATLQPSRSGTWWLDDVAAVPAGTEGYAWLESDQPLSVVVLEQPTSASASPPEDGTAYLGITVHEYAGPGVPAPIALYGPYLPNGGGSVPPATPTSTPTEAPSATPPPPTLDIYLPIAGREMP